MEPDLKQMYRSMLRIRMIEERIAELYNEQEMRCPVHLCNGQEAVAVGVSTALRQDDYVLSGHRAHGHFLAKGGNLKAFIAELYGRATGCCQGRGGSMHLIDLSAGFLCSVPIVGSTISIAVGAALGFRMRREQRVVVPYLGDGATEEGVFHESLNFAALKNLPVVFVCENNHFSVYSPLSVRQPDGREIVDLALGHGIESHRADGNDACAVYRLTAAAVAKARAGQGPSFLEFETYRWREHCGPNYDNDLGYRSIEEFERWRLRCPVATTRERLLARSILTPAEDEQIRDDIAAEIRDAVRFAKESPYPDPATLMEGVFAAGRYNGEAI
jgi:pyruvate dehydrogenase E1 component alpha subunit